MHNFFIYTFLIYFLKRFIEYLADAFPHVRKIRSDFHLEVLHPFLLDQALVFLCEVSLPLSDGDHCPMIHAVGTAEYWMVWGALMGVPQVRHFLHVSD